MNPFLEAAALRLTSAAATADERDRCAVKGADIRLILRELARLQETLLLETDGLGPAYLPRD